MLKKLLTMCMGAKPYIPIPSLVIGYPNHRQCLKHLLCDDKLINHLQKLNNEDCIELFVKKGYEKQAVIDAINRKFPYNAQDLLAPSAPPGEDLQQYSPPTYESVVSKSEQEYWQNLLLQQDNTNITINHV